MSMEDVVLVATVREEIRSSTLRVDTADIPRYLEVAQANRLVSKVYVAQPKSGATREGPDTLMKASEVNLNVRMEDGNTIGVISPSNPQHNSTNKGDDEKSDIERPVSLLQAVLSEMRCD